MAEISNIGKVVMFTNITDTDFSHPFGGQPFFVKAGETVAFPYDLGKHLARHLARRIFLDADKSPRTYDANHPDTRSGVGAPLWNEDTESAMVEKILGKTYEQEVPDKKSEIEILQEQVKALNEQFNKGKQQDEAELIIPDSVANSGTYKDKAEVIAELTLKGIKFDARQSKAKLEELLVEA